MAPAMVRLSAIVSVERLLDDVAAGFIAVRVHENGNARLLNYTAKAQYASHWTKETLTCRGLIVSGAIEEPETCVLARPFAKFANAYEHTTESPFGELPVGRKFEVYEKLDGSLAIGYNLGDGLAFATRGSFVSEQAVAATRLWRERYADVAVPGGVTVLFEYVAPWNRIVVGYEEEELILLGGIDIATGADVDLRDWAFPGPRAARYDGFSDFEEIARHMAENDTAMAEGFVVRFLPDTASEASLRVKMKFAEYLRLHKVVSGVSTVSVFEHLSAGGTLEQMLELLPDEFHAFVREFGGELQEKHQALVERSRDIATSVAGLGRKEAAQVATSQRDVPAGLVFGWLDGKDVANLAWKTLRPDFEEASRAGASV